MNKLSHWRTYFRDRGLPSEISDGYISYAKRLQEKDFPVIFEFEHLSLLLGLNIDPLSRMVASPNNFYREFYIPKRNGGKRKILAPHESLLSAQRWILENILEKVKIHEAAHGFCRGKSIKSNASIHLGSDCLLKMDLKNFFPSIPISWIINVFKDIGYAPNVAYYLASLCCHNEVLAQGASTSPALSNIILKSLDNRLSKLAENSLLRYSRYADDLTFSGKKISHSFSNVVSSIVLDYGLEINSEKTRLKLHHGSRIITGISISGKRLSVPCKFKREIKNEVFFIKKFGILSHKANRKITNPNYLHSLLGKISFWLYVEPDDISAQSARNLIVEVINS
jgi:retron-type reverse transcriptase